MNQMKKIRWWLPVLSILVLLGFTEVGCGTKQSTSSDQPASTADAGANQNSQKMVPNQKEKSGAKTKQKRGKPNRTSRQLKQSKSKTNNAIVNASLASSHNNQSDIGQDLAVIKSKATISVNGVQWKPLIHSQPDAKVPDGTGGMLYAWNVILDGNGDGSAQKIYFFDNNHYIGTDTSKYHLPSSVHAGSTGTIIVTYQHYLANDSSASPSGKPFIVSFHWNGSRLKPNNVAMLNAAVNDQFK